LPKLKVAGSIPVARSMKTRGLELLSAPFIFAFRLFKFFPSFFVKVNLILLSFHGRIQIIVVFREALIHLAYEAENIDEWNVMPTFSALLTTRAE
ncbi:MAG: hypothetical protein JW902_03800, partial [Syntrophaceae bacterium]|nr:hypothetical protein [Syntrophaceae bacterium]